MLSTEADYFAQKLAADRLLQIFVGANKTPYLIQESILKEVSDCFAAGIEHGFWGDYETGKLHFPDDDEETFQVMMYFIINKKLPAYDRKWKEADTQIWLIESWILAEKYALPDLQDLLMMEMLFCLENEVAEWEAIRCAFKKAPEGSKIRMLFVEEALWRVYDGYTDTKEFQEKNAKALDKAILGIPSAWFEILRAQHLSRDRNPWTGRLEDQEKTESYLYGSYAENSPLRSYRECDGEEAMRLDASETESCTASEYSTEAENPLESED